MNPAQLRRVNVESFAHYRQGLIDLLLDAVGYGASVGFMADLDATQARAYFDEVQENVTRQAQGDWVLQEERDGTLYWGAGIATQRADYSLRFNLGMSWEEFHGPVPLVKEIGMLDRALKFLLRLRTGHPVRRLNWSLTVNPRLEVSAESLPEWAPDRTIVTAENAGKLVYLRIELQPLHRLPRSNAIVFPIRTYLLSLEDIATNPAWARRMHRVLRDLDQQLVDYKGFSRYRDAAVQWLSQYDDGRDSEVTKQA